MISILIIVNSRINRERAVSVVIGVMLMLSVLFLAAAQYQVVIVPQQEQTTEVDHHQTVITQIDTIRTNIIGTAETGSQSAQQIKMGAMYEQETIFGVVPKVHPLNPSGKLQTVELASDSRIKFSNAEGTGPSTRSYWTGVNSCPTHCYETNGLEYTIDYNEFSDNSELVYENSLFYERYLTKDEDPEYFVQSGQSLINGRSINLIALTGGLSVNQIRSTSVETIPVSAPSQTVLLTDDSADEDPLILEIPTQLPDRVWRDVLTDEMSSRGGYISQLRVQNNVLRLTLRPDETYSVKMARVHLSSQTQQESVQATNARYISWAGNERKIIPDGTQTQIEAQVRDKFNNPVSGIPTRAYVNDSSGICVGDFVPEQVETDPTDNCSSNQQPGKAASGNDGAVTYYYSADVEDNTEIIIDIDILRPSVIVNPSISPPDGATSVDLASLSQRSIPTVHSSVIDTTKFPDGENHFRILSVDPSQSSATIGSTITVDTLVDNIGRNTISKNITLTSDKNAIITPESYRIRLSPGSHARIRYELTVTQPGKHTLELNGKEVATIEGKRLGNLLFASYINNRFEEEEIVEDPDVFKDGSGNVLERKENKNVPPIVDESTPFTGVIGDIQSFENLGTDNPMRVSSARPLNSGILFSSIEPNTMYTLGIKYRLISSEPVQLQLYKNGDTHVGSLDGSQSSYYLSGENEEQLFQLSSKEIKYIQTQQQAGWALRSNTQTDISVDKLQIRSSQDSILADPIQPVITEFSILEDQVQSFERFTVELEVRNPSTEFKTPLLEFSQKSTFNPASKVSDRRTILVNPQTTLTGNSNKIIERMYSEYPGQYTYSIRGTEEYRVDPDCNCEATITVKHS
ncbi:MAG: hypothetical protein J07HQW2_00412 [Haloquadratum walsbyi J07HQW2]|uniref:CARDB domain-containing protein n=2 Tax=Haloquadratum walsbyi TaxID=293091 RepID=U1NBH1_9EURY|nr:MAG: hypothetical protein J07HQW2_00412 [Haloquadratum walsbyi J07HQW2]